MDYQAAQFGFNVLIALATGGIALYTWQSSRHRATRDEVAALTTRLTTAEERLRNMPDHEDLSKIYTEINGLSKGVHEMCGQMTVISKQVGMLVTTLVEKGVRHE